MHHHLLRKVISVGSSISSDMSCKVFRGDFKWVCQTLRAAALGLNRKVFVRIQESALSVGSISGNKARLIYFISSEAFRKRSWIILHNHYRDQRAAGERFPITRATTRREFDWNFIWAPREQVHSSFLRIPKYCTELRHFHNWCRVLERCQFPTPLVRTISHARI